MTVEKQALFGIEKLNVPRSDIPAVTHVDYSARVQTVHKDTNPRYHALLSAFKARTGCPVLVNTSFNVRGEPIVCTSEDAFHCLWVPTSKFWWPATAISGRKIRIPRWPATTRVRSPGIDPSLQPSTWSRPPSLSAVANDQRRHTSHPTRLVPSSA